MDSNKIIAWWSGGVTSAVACKLAIDLYGKDNVEVIFIDTKNEHPDTYRFKTDCQKWYGVLIGSITGLGNKYKSIEDVWIKHKSLNVANGAICSGTLKRDVRKKWQKDKEYKHQVFGFDVDEPKRARSMKLNNPDVKAIFPLLMYGLSKKDCIKMIEDDGIEVPEMYKLGFHNNNCFKTGCVQGGIGYWQKMKRDFPDKFDKMADMEHKLTDLKGKPVTMLKD
jgi:3'-phosphoadenosine 5'-phosphosulfate sulfotransferase (PAPS reductase)/FAD synthetase